MTERQDDTGELLGRFQAGDQQALAELFTRHRPRLWHMVNARLDPRLAGRVDADDVLQEAFLDASDRMQHYIDEHSGSLFVWLRLIVSQTLANVHRRHLGAQMRDAARDVSISGGPVGQLSSTTLAFQLLGHLTSPTQAVIRDEVAETLERAINSMDPIDREVLALRHFEQLSNSEVAEVLGIQQKAASIRYIRAVKRLKQIISDISGLAEL
jgi:RNA polymerase sigma-70 factor (ECF subfamily)